MPLMFIFLAGIAVALIRRRLLAAPGDPTRHQDAPARLLDWAVGLLAAEREEWGQAMIGELDRLDGRTRRWRFALGCVGAAVVMPPWGRAAAALGALMAVAASATGLALYTHVHYRIHTDGWTWVAAAVLLLVLVGYIFGGSVLLRRPGVAGPGLTGGLLVAAAWLAVGGFTFDRWLNSLWSNSWLLFVAPIVVGVGGTLWGGSAAVGRRGGIVTGRRLLRRRGRRRRRRSPVGRRRGRRDGQVGIARRDRRKQEQALHETIVSTGISGRQLRASRPPE